MPFLFMMTCALSTSPPPCELACKDVSKYNEKAIGHFIISLNFWDNQPSNSSIPQPGSPIVHGNYLG